MTKQEALKEVARIHKCSIRSVYRNPSYYQEALRVYTFGSSESSIMIKRSLIAYYQRTIDNIIAECSCE